MFTKELYEGNKFCLLDIPQDFMLVINNILVHKRRLFCMFQTARASLFPGTVKLMTSMKSCEYPADRI